MNKFSEWTVLVTGASAGLGAEFCRQLAPVAGHLLVVARRQDRLESLRTELAALAPACRVSVYPTDLSQPEAVAKLLFTLKEEGHTIDLLVNNAGLGDIGCFVTSPPEKIQQMLSVNIGALTQLTRALLPAMKERRQGAILNVSSSAGYLPLPSFAVYAATKAYVNSFSEALLAEVRSSNITVTALCPGPVPTEFGTVASRPGEGRQFAPPAWLEVSTAEVVRQALAGCAHGKARVLPGRWIAFFMFWADMMPTVLWRLIYRFSKNP